jgi:peptidoglycan/LPS O-acetylase OafA/YrhL
VYSSITCCRNSRLSITAYTYRCHRYGQRFAKSGAPEVDLFFALSTFLITSLLLREQQQMGGISLRLFYVRRILRIWPLYFAVLAVALVMAHTIQGQRLSWYYLVG